MRICIRRTGVGGDGIILLQKGERAPLRMTIINQDGTIAEISGNGLLCVAAYLDERGEFGKGGLEIETGGGVKKVLKKGAHFALCMGKPRFPSGTGPIRIETGSALYLGYHVETGNPHCVLFLEESNIDVDPWDSLDCIETDEVIPLILRTGIFPNGVNVEFVKERGAEYFVRVIERGVGETLACGSGASATTAALRISGKVKKGGVVSLHFKGGTYTAFERGEGIYIMGRGNIVFSGEIDLPRFGV